MGGRYWVKRNSLPRGPVDITADRLAQLQQALRDHYWPAEMRGKHCKVEHYERKDGRNSSLPTSTIGPIGNWSLLTMAK